MIDLVDISPGFAFLVYFKWTWNSILIIMSIKIVTRYFYDYIIRLSFFFGLWSNTTQPCFFSPTSQTNKLGWGCDRSLMEWENILSHIVTLFVRTKVCTQIISWSTTCIHQLIHRLFIDALFRCPLEAESRNGLRWPSSRLPHCHFRTPPLETQVFCWICSGQCDR